MFASMTDADRIAFYELLDEYFDSRKDMFASWVNARAPAHTAPTLAAATSSRLTSGPPAVSAAYRPSAAAPSPPPAPPAASPSLAAGESRSSAPGANNKYGVTVPSMSDFNDPRFQTAFKVAGSGMSKAGGLFNKHVLGGQDHSKSPEAAGSVSGGAVPPPKAAKPGSARDTMNNIQSVAAGMQAMNKLNSRFAPRQEATAVGGGAAAAVPAPPPPPPNPGAAHLPPPSRHAAPPARHAGIGSCTAMFDYQSGEAGDLNFTEGDRITLISKESDDWWKGSLNGRDGLFPAAYVQEG